MKAEQAFDECIAAALDAANRQRDMANTARDDSARVMHNLSCGTLASFASSLSKIREMRRKAGDL